MNNKSLAHTPELPEFVKHTIFNLLEDAVISNQGGRHMGPATDRNGTGWGRILEAFAYI
jgi:hypothetical protein